MSAKSLIMAIVIIAVAYGTNLFLERIAPRDAENSATSTPITSPVAEGQISPDPHTAATADASADGSDIWLAAGATDSQVASPSAASDMDDDEAVAAYHEALQAIESDAIATDTGADSHADTLTDEAQTPETDIAAAEFDAALDDDAPVSPPAATPAPTPAPVVRSTSAPVATSAPVRTATPRAAAARTAAPVVSLEPWWGAESATGLSIVYAGSAAYTRAVVLMFNGEFADASAAQSQLQVTDSNGRAVAGQWQVNPKNPRMLLFPVSRNGIYTITAKPALSDRNGRSLGSQQKGPVRVN